MSRRGTRGLATQAALAMAAVVAVALGLTGAVALQLIRGAAERQALDSLDRQASVIASLVASPTELTQPARLAGKLKLGRQDIQLVTVTAAGSAQGRFAAALPAADRAVLLRGQDVRGIRRRAARPDERLLLAGHPVAGGGAVVLFERASVAKGVTRDGRRRILTALAIGLFGSAAVGFLLTRQLARPLQQAAAAANDMAGGRRDVRLRPEGPAEVAELAAALNTLAGALAASEGRQRDFLLSISHELRTPLTSISGFAEALADGVVPRSEVAATGEVIRSESARLERLVSDLLDLARLTATDFRLEQTSVDLVALVREASRVWAARAAAAGIELRLELAAQPVLAAGDRTRLRQVLDGLAENALRVTPAGQPLVLAVRQESAGAVLEVRDGGPGLTDDDLRVAFDRSALYDRYRGTRRVGAGVGLALVAGLAARMGGTAAAGHAAEGGARFTITLARPAPAAPLAKSGPAAPPAALPPAAPAAEGVASPARPPSG